MALVEWLSQLGAYVSGLITWPLATRVLGGLFGEARAHWRGVAAARRVIEQQLDPLLKSADELHGKLRSLAEEDFADFRNMPHSERTLSQLVDLCSTLYLFAQFWARLEVLRRESFHAELSATSSGALLLKFQRSLESRRIRLVDRAWQRAIGELVVGENRRSVIAFSEFVERYEAGGRLCRWFEPLEELLRDTWRGPAKNRQRRRQRILQYGVIIHALVDTLDPKHRTTRERPAYANKLTRRTKRELIGRVFGTYLPDVTRQNVQKYTEINV